MSMTPFTSLSLVLSFLLLPGCLVTQSKYDALGRDFANYRQAALEREAEQDAKIESLVSEIAAQEKKIAELQGDIKRLEGEKVALMNDKAKLSAAESQLVEALRELQERKAAAEQRVAEYRQLLSRFQSLIDSGKLRVRIVDGQMVVELATDVLFSSASAVLSAEGRAAVAEVTQVLASIPDKKYQIDGHTDNVPIKSSKYPSNWYLAFDRAHSVLQAMLNAGMPVENVTAASSGEYRPTASNDTEEGRAQNRRIDIIVVPDMSSLPGTDELLRLESPDA